VNEKSYEERIVSAATAAIAKGHHDPENLRQLLIWTTATPTFPMIDAYFRRHHTDNGLLTALVQIALEGEDCGDAPWAAANTIANFPSEMLASHRDALESLAAHPWDYLNVPAKEALAKINAIAI
jgi:hypothetical protein